MVSKYATNAGGTLLCLSALLTGGYMIVEDPGFIMMVLIVNAALFVAAGTMTLSNPGRAPVFGGFGAGLAVVTFVLLVPAPMWAIPGVVGGVLCIAGGLRYRQTLPTAQGQ